MKKQINPRSWVLAAIILSAGIFRLFAASGMLASWANFTPLGAMAIFGGCYYQEKWKGYFVPILTLWFSDIILNRFVFFHEWVFFYDGFGWVYASFVFMVLIGHFIKKVSVKSVVLSALAGAIVHLVVSDMGAWWDGTDVITGLPFTHDVSGLLRCYYLALPFMKNMLIGNLVFGAIFFGTFEYLQTRYPALKLRRAAH